MAKYPADNAPFDEWLKWVFDHPVSKPAWYEDERGDWWEGSGSTRIEFMTRLFESPIIYLLNFSDAQTSQGLWFLTGDACLNTLASLMDESVAWAQRQRCLNSILKLFVSYFAVRCSQHLSNLDEHNANPLNVTCYMWWDQLHTSKLGEPSSTVVNTECVSVMGRILELPHDACRESALHGLGHWQQYIPEKVIAIIDSFLVNNPNLRPELSRYALKARAGHVL